MRSRRYCTTSAIFSRVLPVSAVESGLAKPGSWGKKEEETVSAVNGGEGKL